MCGAMTVKSPDGTTTLLLGANSISFATNTVGLLINTCPVTRIFLAVTTGPAGRFSGWAASSVISAIGASMFSVRVVCESGFVGHGTSTSNHSTVSTPIEIGHGCALAKSRQRSNLLRLCIVIGYGSILIAPLDRFHCRRTAIDRTRLTGTTPHVGRVSPLRRLSY